MQFGRYYLLKRGRAGPGMASPFLQYFLSDFARGFCSLSQIPGFVG
jgi:hypothetical protein